MGNLSVREIIDKIVMKFFPQQLSPLTLLLTFAMAFVVGMGIFLVYRKYFSGVVYDHAFSISLVIMSILVSVIIVTISTNIALSLGMVGALSIVRYRTAVKNPLDLMFMFWAITSGIAIGAQYYYIAVIAFVFVTFVFVFLRRTKGVDQAYILIVNFEKSSKVEDVIKSMCDELKGKIRSKIIRNGIVELTVELCIRAEEEKITDKISSMAGVRDVMLVQYRGNDSI